MVIECLGDGLEDFGQWSHCYAGVGHLWFRVRVTDNATFGRSVHVRATTWLSHLLGGSIIFIFRHPQIAIANWSTCSCLSGVVALCWWWELWRPKLLLKPFPVKKLFYKFNHVASQWAIGHQILASNNSVLLVTVPIASFVRIFLVWMFREFLQQLKNSLSQPGSFCDRNSCIILPATWHLTFRVCFLVLFVCHSCSWFDSCSWYILMWLLWIFMNVS